jgi:uncharacterized protein (DUF58 family)
METTATTRADLFDPAKVAALGRIEIVARWVVDGFLTGLHRSPRKGFSVEFAEHRPYLPGDDLRYLDWKIVARSDRWLVKQFEEETNLRCTIVLDVSRSMAWTGSPTRLTKLAYAEHLVASIALLLLRQRDAVGIIRFDEGLRSVLRPQARRQQWRRIINTLDEGGSGLESHAPEALMQAGRVIRRKGMVVLISDLLMDEQHVADAVASLRAAGHDVAVFHIVDPAERDLSVAAEAIFVDPESGAHVEARVADVQDAYRSTVDVALEEWRSRIVASGASYALVATDVPFGVPLRQAFAARQRLP